MTNPLLNQANYKDRCKDVLALALALAFVFASRSMKSKQAKPTRSYLFLSDQSISINVTMRILNLASLALINLLK